MEYRSKPLPQDHISIMVDSLDKEFYKQTKALDQMEDSFLDRHPDWFEFAVDKDPALKKYQNEDGSIDKENLRKELKHYPGLKVIVAHEIAKELYDENPKDPNARAISELAATISGADIHPGANIDPYVFIDHTKGVIIGETASVGKGTQIFQNVTLGGIGGKTDEHGNRHPQVGENVVLSAGTQIMGPEPIGDGTKIGPACQIVRTKVGAGVVMGFGTNISELADGINDNTYLAPRGQQLFRNSKTNAGDTPRDAYLSFINPNFLSIDGMKKAVDNLLAA